MDLRFPLGAFGAWSIDESRHARENIPPADYLGASYYEIWVRALEVLLQRHGFVTADEIDAGHKQNGRSDAEARPQGRHGGGRAGQGRLPATGQ